MLIFTYDIIVTEITLTITVIKIVVIADTNGATTTSFNLLHNKHSVFLEQYLMTREELNSYLQKELSEKINNQLKRILSQQYLFYDFILYN